MRATANRFLNALPQELLAQWLGQGQILTLKSGDIVDTASRAGTSVFFPLNAVLAWVSWLSDGASSAIALIGSEGMVSLKDFQGEGHQLVVVHKGTVLRLPASLVESSERIRPAVLKLRTDNLHALMTQASQTAVCNQHHTLQQRLMRLLQCIFDRTEGHTLHITQSQLAELLGTRREGVSHAASMLQQMGWIRYSRGQIHLMDRTRAQSGLYAPCGCMHLPAG